MTILNNMEGLSFRTAKTWHMDMRLRLQQEADRLLMERARLDEETVLAAQEGTRLTKSLYVPRPELHKKETLARKREATARAADYAALTADRDAHEQDQAVVAHPLKRWLHSEAARLARQDGLNARRCVQEERQQAQNARQAQLLRRQKQQFARYEKRRIQKERQLWRETRDALSKAAKDIRKSGDIEETRAAWARLRAHDPEGYMARMGEIALLRQTGQFEAIEQEFSTYARDIKEHPERDLRLARVADAGKLLDLAKLHIKQALMRAPRDFNTLRWAVRFFVKHGFARQACLAFEACLADVEVRAVFQNSEIGDLETQRSHFLEALRIVGWDVAVLGLPPEAMCLHDEIVRALCTISNAPSDYTPVPGRVMHVLPSFGPGGVQRQTLNLVTHLPERSARLERFVMLPLKSDDNLEFHRGAFRDAGAAFADSLPQEGSGPDLEDLFSCDQVMLLRQLPKRNVQEISHVVTQIRLWQPEIIHAWSDPVNISAGIAAALVGVPRAILGARSSAPTGRRAATSAPFTRAAYQALLTRPGNILTTNSQAAGREFEEWLEREQGSVITVYNGIDLNEVIRDGRAERAAQMRQSLGIAPHAAVVGAAFRFNAEKRPFLWVEAAARTIARRPDTHFVLLGDGILRPTLIKLLAERGLTENIHLPGLSDEVLNWIVGFDAVFLTSRYEGTANIALEAQALGRPVVLPDVGGLAETFLPGKTGLLTSADPDPDECAEQILACLNQPTYAAAAKAQGELFIKGRFGIRTYVDGYRACYGWQPDVD